MKDKPVHIFIDAQSRSFRWQIRFTEFGENLDAIEEHYADWVEENKLTQHDIWYANVFVLDTKEHIAKMIINDDGSITTKLVRNSHLDPYCRSLKQKLRRIMPDLIQA